MKQHHKPTTATNPPQYHHCRCGEYYINTLSACPLCRRPAPLPVPVSFVAEKGKQVRVIFNPIPI